MKYLKKFNEEFDPMGSWNPKHPSNKVENNILTDDIIKNELKKRLKGSKYDNVEVLDDRIEQLLKLHQTWLRWVKKEKRPLEDIVDSILKYEKNLNKGTTYRGDGPFD